MAIPYKIHSDAYREYLAAYQWYEFEVEGLGERFLKAVENRISQISDNPQYYSIISREFRQVKVAGFPFIISYRFFPRRKFIHIASITHSKRNDKSKFRKEQR